MEGVRGKIRPRSAESKWRRCLLPLAAAACASSPAWVALSSALRSAGGRAADGRGASQRLYAPALHPTRGAGTAAARGAVGDATAVAISAANATAAVSSSGTRHVGAWSGLEEVYELRPEGDGVGELWRAPPRPGAKELHVLRGLLRPEEVDRALRVAEVTLFDSEAADSTNPVQTPVVVLKAAGDWQAGASAERLREVVEEAIEQRVVPYMRELYGDASLVASEVLLRQYVPEEKAVHALHFDHHAASTCVVDLAPQPGSGLFVQSGPDAASRRFVPLHSAGDAVVHGWDLFHGVALRAGHQRVSLIVWAKPEADARSGDTSWYHALADKGDVDASYRLGVEAQCEDRVEDAMRWFNAAAHQGHWMAMWRLGKLAGSDGFRWTERAAEVGWPDAQVDLGDARQRLGDHAAAAALYAAAAEQQHPAGLHRLGLCQLRGWGVQQDALRARGALEASARLGWADAQFLLGQSLSRDEAERHAWLSAASAQGHPGASNSLAVDAAKAGNHGEARELLLAAAQKGHGKAMANLALYLRQGVGGPSDPAAAEEWEARARATADR